MDYVFLDIETTGLDYKKDEIIRIECRKYDTDFKELDQLVLCVKPSQMVSEFVKNFTKITDKELENGSDLKEALEKLKVFVHNCYIICFHSEFDLSFLLTAMYQTHVDLSFWYFDLFVFFQKKLHYKGTISQLFEKYQAKYLSGISKYIELTEKYMEESHIGTLYELVKVRPNQWNCIFRGIHYPEYLVDSVSYNFYMVDFTKDKYPSYLACLKEIRREYFTLEELVDLTTHYDMKLLGHITELNEETIKITNDYYIMSYGPEINPSEKWGKDYIEKLESAARFLSTHSEKVEITCYHSIQELEEKTKRIDSNIMNIIKSRIVREKVKWSRW